MEDCDVCIGVSDGESSDFWNEDIVKAKKRHECEECEDGISPGQQYHRIVYKYDGEIHSMSICMFCYEVGTVFSCGDGTPWGVLWSEMREYAFPKLTTASPCFAKLSPSSKQRLLDKWREWKGLKRSA